MQDYIGKQIDRYRVTARLGMGGMAAVFKAYDTLLDRDIAIKVIRTSDIPESQHKQMMKRFEREAKAQARFSHPNIVPVYDYGEVDGFPYLVMEYLTGGSLKDRGTGPVDYQQAIGWLIAISDALAYAHNRRVVHRDVKPGNILFDEVDRPMLTDFGIAKALSSDQATLTGTGLSLGTPEYMAPEQWQGHASEATDQYALGVVLYELITGKRPFTADTPAAVVILQATEPLKPPRDLIPGIPEPLEKLLYKALARDPQDRCENMAAFKQSLSSLLEERVTLGVDKTMVYDQQTILPVVDDGTELIRESEMVDGISNVHLAEEKQTALLPQSASVDAPRKKVPPWLKWAGLAIILVGLACVGMVIILSVTGFFGSRRDIKPPVVGVDEVSTQEAIPISGLVNTPSLTEIPEATHTSSPEPSDTSTIEPSPSPSKTEVIFPTPTRYLTPTPQAYYPLQNCAASHLYLNDSSFVSYTGGKNSLRSEPDTSISDNIIANTYPGEVLIIVDGPVCNFGWILWEVKTTRNEIGWTPETNGVDYWLLPLTTHQLCDDALPSRLVVGNQAKVNEEPALANLVRDEPDRSATVIGRIPPGEWMMVLEGPHCGEKVNWWMVEALATGIIGWTMEGDAEVYYLSPEP